METDAKKIVSRFRNPFVPEGASGYGKFAGYALWGLCLLVSLPLVPLALLGRAAAEAADALDPDGREGDLMDPARDERPFDVRVARAFAGLAFFAVSCGVLAVLELLSPSAAPVPGAGAESPFKGLSREAGPAGPSETNAVPRLITGP